MTVDVIVDSAAPQKFAISNKLTMGETSGFPPALAYHKGNLWIAWVGVGNNQLNVVRLDRTNAGGYTENKSTKNTINSTTFAAPSLASDGNRLYLSFTGVGSKQVCIVSALNGNDFEPASKNILNSESAFPPQLAVLDGKLFIGFAGVNGGDFSFIGPATIDSVGKAEFSISDKRTLPKTILTTFLSMTAYDDHLVFAGSARGANNVVLYSWKIGQNLPTNPYASFKVNGNFAQCAASHAIKRGGSLWLSYLFFTGSQTDVQAGYGALDGTFFWYASRVVDNDKGGADIQGSCSLFGSSPQGYATVAVSDDEGVVDVAWIDGEDRLNVGTLPAKLTGL